MILGIATITGVLLLLGLAALIIDADLKLSWHLTKVEKGGYKIVVAQGTPQGVLDNLEGRHYDWDDKTVRPGERNIGGLRGYLEKEWGIYYVSAFYPYRQIHKFSVTADKLRPKKEMPKDAKISDRIKPGNYDVEYLLHLIPHPTLCLNVELPVDGYEFNAITSSIYEVVDPITVIFSYKGKVVATLDSVIEGALNDLCIEYPTENGDHLNWKAFRNLAKGKGSEFAKELTSRINGQIVDSTGNHLYGVRLCDIWIEDYELGEKQEEEEKATKAKATAELLAEAALAEARGKMQARFKEAQGEKSYQRRKLSGVAAGIKEFSETLKDHFTSEQIAAMVREQLLSGNVAESDLTTWVQKGGNAQVAVTPQPPAPPNQQANP